MDVSRDELLAALREANQAAYEIISQIELLNSQLGILQEQAAELRERLEWQTRQASSA